MDYAKNILETIGNTPMVKLNKVVKDLPCTVLAKVETFNPGNSIKDRMAVQMIEDAEKEGKLKPGGTIIEGTSGNTGMGLAIASIVKGYKLICTMPDKQSKEKMDILRAVGAEVVVTPTNVMPEDPRSYYSVARRLSQEIPNSFYPNQYDNLSNTKAHYLTTGPEIWKQTEGKITHLVVGVGTGGTICGTGKYLKEKNPAIKIWGIDTYGSVFKKYHETGIFDTNEIYSYLTEGIGEDILPANVDFKVIDQFEKVTDKDGMLMTRRLAREEGIFVGNSAGSAVAGLLQLKDQLKPEDVVVVIFHDHGSRYVGKIFNDDWMKERGMLDRSDKTTAYDILKKVNQQQLVSITPETTIADAIAIITGSDVSQLPVIQDSEMVGSVSEHQLFAKLVENPELKSGLVKEIMQPAFPIVNNEAGIEDISQQLKSHAAVLVKDAYGKMKIITRHDIIKALAD
ncbi:MAG: pyridoxal-phosphate dependent enzyme [Bacteroidia bacterium]|nr:pyridoxal-phosphate dependent enzyme [Bacteroidia bacterium]